MYAVILREPGASCPSFCSIYGAPLIERQLSWLAGLGVEEVVIEIGPDEEGERMLQWIQSAGNFGLSIRPVVTNEIDTALDSMSRAPVSVVITNSALICTRLDHLVTAMDGGNILVRPPCPEGAVATCIGVISGGSSAVEVVWPHGWACQIRDANDASRISARIASGQLECDDYTDLVS